MNLPILSFRRVVPALLLTTCFWASARSTKGQVNLEDGLAVLGAGRAGDWVTEYTFANGGPDTIDVSVTSRLSYYLPCTIPTFPYDCSSVTLVKTLSPNASHVTDHPLVGLNHAVSDLSASYVWASNLDVLGVRARAKNLSTSQSLDLPVIRVSRILQLNPQQLVFAGATRTASSHSNLVLANLGCELSGCDSDFRVSFAVEAYSGEGQTLASRQLELFFDQSLFIVDVLGFLGVSELHDGQIRVRKTDSGGVLWGILPSLDSDGSLSISVGAHP